VPNTTCFWKHGGTPGAGGSKAQRSFRILDLSDDGVHVHVTTDEPGGFPTLPGAVTPYSIQTHAAPTFQLTNCTGDRDVVAMSGFSAAPMGSRWRYTFTTNIGTTQATIPMIGEVVSVVFDITSTFGAGTLTLDGPFTVNMADGSQGTWNPVVDLTRGPRTITITPSGAVSTPIGIGGADNALALPSTRTWLMPEQITPKMFSVSAPGSITLSFATDQGVAQTSVTTYAAPLGLRVHA
jgi:hypothetical protein